MTLMAETAAPSAELAAAVGATLQNIAKLKGQVNLTGPGSLPNDGKAIADERKYD
jgi:phenylacetate-CoA ligase